MTTPPSPPSQLYSYTAFQQAQGDNAFPGTQLDADLANLIGSNTAIITFINSAFRSDGKLANAFVNREALGPDIRIGFDPPTPWATATAYAANDAVYYLNAFYFCNTAHTSGSFATDLANGLWTLAADFEQAAEASLVDFEKKYLGAFDAPPTLDNTGQPLETGALYFDTGALEMYVWNGSGWQSTVASEARRREVIATATAGQTTFTVAGGYSPNQADVWLNGAKQKRGEDFSASSGDVIIFTTPLDGGEFVNIVCYAAANIVYTTSDFVGFDPGLGVATRTVEDKLRDYKDVKDYGAVGDGETDDGPAFTLMSADGPVVVPKGTFAINGAITVATVMAFEPGAQLVGTGSLVQNAPVWAGPFEPIYGFGLTVTGTFGSGVISPCWFGAVSDGTVVNSGPTRTNNYTAFRRLSAARTRSPEVGAIIRFPGGRFWYDGAAGAAVSNPLYGEPGQPQYLVGEGVLQLRAGDSLVGEPFDATQIIPANSATGAVIRIGAPGTQGPPSNVSDLMIVAALGGAGGAQGIYADANGTFISRTWVSGFDMGYRLASTDQFLDRFVAEYCNVSIRSDYGNQNITNGTLYQVNQDGIVVDHITVDGTTLLDNVRINVANGTSGRWAVAADGPYTQINMANVVVDSDKFSPAFRLTGVADFSMTSCKARLSGDSSAVLVGDCQKGTITDFKAYKRDGTAATSSKGIEISGTSANITVTGGDIVGYNTGVSVNTTGVGISLLGVNTYLNTGRGIDVFRAPSIRITGCRGFANGIDNPGSTDNAGLRVRQNDPFERATITGCEFMGQNNGVQDYGVDLICNNANSKIVCIGNTMAYNGATNASGDNLRKTGSSASNILGDATNNGVG